MTNRSDIPRSEPPQAPSRLTRRGLLVGGVVVLGTIGLGASRWFNVTAEVSASDLSVQDAHQAALSGTITLIDIRRPDEWARTGIGEGAVPIDMRRDDFTDALLAEVASPDAPIALICARGVRSKRLSNRLTTAGFTRIIDVPEGMLGSGAGPGWLRSNLPVRFPQT